MRVSLKKAAALATALGGVAVQIPSGIAASIYSDDKIDDLIASGCQQQGESLTKALAYAKAQYDIRKLIGEANAAAINTLLTDRAAIDKQLQILNSIALIDKQPDVGVLTKKLDAMKEAPKNDSIYRGREENIIIPLPNADKITPLVKEFKKARIKVEDALAHLNFTTEIELPDDVVAILRENDLI